MGGLSQIELELTAGSADDMRTGSVSTSIQLSWINEIVVQIDGGDARSVSYGEVVQLTTTITAPNSALLEYSFQCSCNGTDLSDVVLVVEDTISAIAFHSAKV